MKLDVTALQKMSAVLMTYLTKVSFTSREVKNVGQFVSLEVKRKRNSSSSLSPLQH